MADTLTVAERSARMALVRSHGNKDTELRLILLLRRRRITGWRRNTRVFGRPDFIFPLQRVAVFVDGCFWHGCPKHGRIPKSRRQWWIDKIQRNRARDAVVKRTLRRRGWKVLRIWEHELARKQERALVRRLRRMLREI